MMKVILLCMCVLLPGCGIQENGAVGELNTLIEGENAVEDSDGKTIITEESNMMDISGKKPIIDRKEGLLSIENEVIYSAIVDGASPEDERGLKEVSREERKLICEKLMSEYRESDPELAFSGANCLLYNGYGKLAIPLFAEYIYGPNNKKYFNGRIGYGWLHSADWYNVGGEVFTQMTGEKELYTWILEEIYKEVYDNLEKYEHSNPGTKKLIIRQSLNNIGSLEKLQALSEEEQELIGEKQLSCPFLIQNVGGFRCIQEYSSEYIQCVKDIDNLSEECKSIFMEEEGQIGSNCQKNTLGVEKVLVQCERDGNIEILYEN